MLLDLDPGIFILKSLIMLSLHRGRNTNSGDLDLRLRMNMCAISNLMFYLLLIYIHVVKIY